MVVNSLQALQWAANYMIYHLDKTDKLMDVDLVKESPLSPFGKSIYCPALIVSPDRDGYNWDSHFKNAVRKIISAARYAYGQDPESLSDMEWTGHLTSTRIDAHIPDKFKTYRLVEQFEKNLVYQYALLGMAWDLPGEPVWRGGKADPGVDEVVFAMYEMFRRGFGIEDLPFLESLFGKLYPFENFTDEEWNKAGTRTAKRWADYRTQKWPAAIIDMSQHPKVKAVVQPMLEHGYKISGGNLPDGLNPPVIKQEILFCCLSFQATLFPTASLEDIQEAFKLAMCSWIILERRHDFYQAIMGNFNGWHSTYAVLSSSEEQELFFEISGTQYPAKTTTVISYPVPGTTLARGTKVKIGLLAPYIRYIQQKDSTNYRGEAVQGLDILSAEEIVSLSRQFYRVKVESEKRAATVSKVAIGVWFTGLGYATAGLLWSQFASANLNNFYQEGALRKYLRGLLSAAQKAGEWILEQLFEDIVDPQLRDDMQSILADINKDKDTPGKGTSLSGLWIAGGVFAALLLFFGRKQE